MLRQLLLGGAVSLGNIAIHALVMAMVVGTARRALKHRQPQAWLTTVINLVGALGLRLIDEHVKSAVSPSPVSAEAAPRS